MGKEMKREKRRGDGYRLTGSVLAKIVVFFLLGLSFLAGFLGTMVCVCIGKEGFYVNSLNEVTLEMLSGPSRSVAYLVANYLEMGDVEAAREVCQGKNIDIEVSCKGEADHMVSIWSTWSGYDTEFIVDTSIVLHQPTGLELSGHVLQEDEPYLFRAYLRPGFPEADEFQRLEKLVRYVYEFRYALIGVAAGGIFLFLVCFLFLMCSAGHRNGQEGVVPGVLTGIPVDVVTVLFGMVLAFVAYFCMGIGWNLNDVEEVVLLTFLGLFAVVWGTIYCMDLAARLKLGKCFRNSLVFLVLRGGWRFLRLICRGAAGLLRGAPLILTTLIAYFGLFILELIGVSRFVWEQEGVMLWLLEKLLLLPVVMYVALTCKRFLKAGEALAEGHGDYKVDTARMFGDFREHGENLNSLGEGISRAVAERMRSERLKTELITNVSHDLKTPLTSIINYADLIYEEISGGGAGAAGNQRNDGVVGRADSCAAGLRAARTGTAGASALEAGEAVGVGAVEAEGGAGMSAEEEGGAPVGRDGDASTAEGDMAGFGSPANARIAEYSQVLLRQSRRLKKLLEDLLEASKATTGNLEVNLEPCEVGVLLSQAVGEYQQRMDEKRLELIVRQPEGSVHIMADGRHLWRIFDNLLNNICKYAQEDTRVYLSVEASEGYVQIIFRNMSKYALDISAEELEERFVRGDRSRHMEGNGLGLSIARSLVDIQGGRMEITIDGDLFKVQLIFAEI